MSNEDKTYPWIWDHFDSEEALFEEFLKGPDKWDEVFNHWVVQFIANELVDNWLAEHDDTDLIRKAAEFMECHSMNEVGDPDVEEMVEMVLKKRAKAKRKNDRTP